VERQCRRLRLLHLLELGSAALLTAGTIVVLQRKPNPQMAVWAILVWATTVAATTFSIWNWRVLWTAGNQSVAEFTLTYRKRCLASLRAARFGRRLLIVQLAISIPWLTWAYYRHGLSGFRFGIGIIASVLLGAVFLSWIAGFQRRAQEELGHLENFHRYLAEEHSLDSQ
jgi:hypothetical protein